MIINHNCCIKLVPLVIFKFISVSKGGGVQCKTSNLKLDIIGFTKFRSIQILFFRKD